MNGKVIVAGILLIVFGVGAYALYDLKLSPEMKAGRIYREARMTAERGTRESYNSAVGMYIKLMAAYPDTSYARKSYLAFTDLYEKMGLYRHAYINYGYFLKTYGRRLDEATITDVRARIAALKLRQNRTDEGLNQLYAILNQTTDNSLRSRIYSEIGHNWLKRGDVKKAMDAFNLSLYENPNNEESLLGRARVFVRQGSYNDAFDTYDHFLKYHGEFSQYAPDVRNSYLRQSYDAAITAYRKGKYAYAQGLFGRVIRNFPSSRLAENSLYWSGECAYQLGQYRSAISYFTRTLTNPSIAKDEDARLKRGIAYFSLREYRSAVKDFDSYLSTYPRGRFSATAMKWKDAALAEIGQREKVETLPEEEVVPQEKPSENEEILDKKVLLEEPEETDESENAAVAGESDAPFADVENITEL